MPARVFKFALRSYASAAGLELPLGGKSGMHIFPCVQLLEWFIHLNSYTIPEFRVHVHMSATAPRGIELSLITSTPERACAASLVCCRVIFQLRCRHSLRAGCGL